MTVGALSGSFTDAPAHLAGAAECQPVRDWIAFHIGPPLTGPDTADFALGRWSDLMPVTRFRIGHPDYPDGSANVIIEVDDLAPPATA